MELDCVLVPAIAALVTLSNLRADPLPPAAYYDRATFHPKSSTRFTISQESISPGRSFVVLRLSITQQGEEKARQQVTEKVTIRDQ